MEDIELEAKDLQIDDWVQTQRDICGHCCCDVNEQVDCYMLERLEKRTDCVSAIIVTPEMIKKNRFDESATYSYGGFCDSNTKRYEKYETLNKTVGVSISFSSDGIHLYVESRNSSKVVIAKISYVHELQQALRFCGYSKLANKFKL